MGCLLTRASFVLTMAEKKKSPSLLKSVQQGELVLFLLLNLPILAYFKPMR
jgi:hypothetical protein